MKSQGILSIEELNIGDFVRCRFYYLYKINSSLVCTDSNEIFNAIFTGIKTNIPHPGWNKYHFYTCAEDGHKLYYTFYKHIRDITLLC